ncbi:unnamed protein product [marine sediment metagenome]|uniref:Replication protein n=1 Tax=marine sediment metagenome TaxID=412755 RepID=X1BDL6_9ZZZZ
MDPVDWSFNQLSRFYQKKNTICMSNALGVIYNPATYDNRSKKSTYRGPHVNQISCGKFHCDRCRPRLKYRMKLEIENAMVEHKLYTHFVITTEGTKYRDKNDYFQSYLDMSKAFNKIRNILSYDAKKQGKHFTYICLVRAQKKGYCHLHVMTNLYIPKQRLKEISNNYFNTGFIKIKPIKNRKRLSNYFMKDEEWHIPLGRRHYSCSRDIDLDMDIDDIPEDCMHIRLEPGVSVVDQVYDQVELNYGYPPPFDFLLQHFTTVSLHVSHHIKEPVRSSSEMVDNLRKAGEHVYLDENGIIVWAFDNVLLDVTASSAVKKCPISDVYIDENYRKDYPWL